MAERLRVPQFKHGKMELERLLDFYDDGFVRLLNANRTLGESTVRRIAPGILNAVVRGMPLGPIVLWDTVDTEPSITPGMAAAPGGTGVSHLYVVDGVQRFLCLHRVLSSRTSDSPFDLYWDLEEDEVRVRRWTGDGEPPATWLPLRAARRTTDFLAHMRRIEPRNADLVDRAHDLSGILKRAIVPTLTIIGGPRPQLSEAIISFNHY